MCLGQCNFAFLLVMAPGVRLSQCHHMHCAGGHEEEKPAEAPPSAANGSAKTGTDAKVGSAPGGPDAKSGSALGVKGDSKLRRGAVGFEWKDVMLTPPTSVTARDAVYELGSMLSALALWKMARAAQLCADSRQGASGEAVSQVILAHMLRITNMHRHDGGFCHVLDRTYA